MILQSLPFTNSCGFFDPLYESTSTINSEEELQDHVLIEKKILSQNVFVENKIEQNQNQKTEKAKNIKEKIIDHTKQKSQLCKTYMEHGYCPYNNKCKFAHGSHQLRQNLSMNTRYKTKQCGSFFKRYFCVYGNRCNFVHHKEQNIGIKLKMEEQKWKNILTYNRSTIYEARQSSRLLQILKTSN